MSGLDISGIIDRDEIKEAKLSIKDPKGKVLRVDASYYPNRITTEQSEDEPDDEVVDAEDGADRSPAPLWDTSFCEFLAGWDVTGLVKTRKGEPVAGTGAGIVVPLDPYITQYLPLWFKQNIQSALIEIEYPSQEKSRRSRRR